MNRIVVNELLGYLEVKIQGFITIFLSLFNLYCLSNNAVTLELITEYDRNSNNFS